jgi:hypothetical protein
MLRRDPLIHFLVLGGLLFAVLSWLDREPKPDEILISADQVAELARTASLLAGRAPSRDELEDIVGDAIRDEVYYRQALALGLDVDDDEVRRRLIEKMKYLTENTADPEPPAADLVAYFETHRETFRIPELVSFEQLYFSPSERGDSVRADAEAALASLSLGEDVEGFGDSTPLNRVFDSADRDRVRVLFGDALTAAVFSEPLDVWLGPYESDFGWHIVRILERTPARDPEFAEVEAEVRDAFAADRLQRANEAAYAEIRANYDIAVQWEPDSAPEAWP